MFNLFDFVEEFYRECDYMEEIISYKQTESFLLYLSWQNKSEEELHRAWQQLQSFYMYLTHNEVPSEIMDRQRLLASAGWCCRNIGEFPVDINEVQEYMALISDFYRHTMGKNLHLEQISSLELEEMLTQCRQQLILGNSTTSKAATALSLQTGSDLEEKIILDMDSAMEELLYRTGCYFDSQDDKHIFRQGYYKYAELSVQVDPYLAQAEDREERLWLPYILEFRLEDGSDLTPLEYYLNLEQLDLSVPVEKAAYFLGRELVNAPEIYFTITSSLGHGLYACRDFFTGQDYTFTFDTEQTRGLDSWLFRCRLAYGEILLPSCLQFINLLPMQQARLRKDLEIVRQWLSVGRGRLLSWPNILNKHTFLMRALVTAFGQELLELKQESYEPLLFYRPEELVEDGVTTALDQMYRPDMLSLKELEQIKQLWCDFKAAADPLPLPPALWALALMETYLVMNNPQRRGTLEKLMGDNKPAQLACISGGRQLEQVLQLQEYDPRYCSLMGSFRKFILKEVQEDEM